MSQPILPSPTVTTVNASSVPARPTPAANPLIAAGLVAQLQNNINALRVRLKQIDAYFAQPSASYATPRQQNLLEAEEEALAAYVAAMEARLADLVAPVGGPQNV